MLSIIIPSKNELFLKRTIEDVLEKATGEIEIFPVLDGYDIPEEEVVKDGRVHYVHLEKTDYSKKRQGINKVVRELAHGEYVCWIDAHCMMAKGFDTQLIKDHQPNMVLVPKRKRLDPFTWTLQKQSDSRPDIDYEHFLWYGLLKDHGLHGFKWDKRTLERKDILVDDILTCQGSFFFMEKIWFEKCGFMDLKYQGWGQESEEVVLQTIKMGGRVCVTKNTWYSHWHKGKFGRGYHLPKKENLESYEYSFNHWCIENKELFIKHINNFPNQPNWPKNWEELLYETK
jgi:hypothetical protein